LRDEQALNIIVAKRLLASITEASWDHH